MTSSRWRWGEAKTIKFVRCYKQQRRLWDQEDVDYKNKHRREVSYRAIVEAMQDDEITTKCVRNKIKNLRSTYHQELKKIKESVENAGEPYKPQLCWFYEMDSFMGDLTNLNGTEKRAVPEETEHVDLSSNTFEVEEHSIKREHQSSDSETDTEVLPEPEVSEEPENPPAKRRRRDVAKVSNVINRLQNIATVLDGSAKAVKEDEFYYFGLNIAAQLRKLPLDIALQMQAEIQNKLYLVRAKSVNRQGPREMDVFDSD